MIHRWLQLIAALPLLPWLMIHVIAPADRRLMRMTRGRLSLTGRTTVLLVTRGARSGQLRYSTLPGLYQEDRLVLLASKAGAKTHPAWYHNLAAHPDVEVIKGGQRRRYRAEITEGEQRQRLWAWLLQQWQGFAAYQERAGSRVLPVVVLHPQQAGKN